MNSRSRLTVRLYRTFIPYLKPYSLLIVLGGICALGMAVVDVATPWPLKLVFDRVLLDRSAHGWQPDWLLAGDKFSILTRLCGLMVLIVTLDGFLSYLSRYLLSLIGQNVSNDIRVAVFEHLQRTTPASRGSSRAGDVVMRMTSDMKALRDLLVNHLNKLGAQSLSFFAVLAAMMWMDWRLTLLALAIIPPLAAVSYHFSSKIRHKVRRKQSKESDVASMVHENLTSLAAIQANTQEDREKARFVKESEESRQAAVDSTRWGKALNQMIQVFTAAGLGLVVWYGGRKVLNGSLNPGDLIVFAAYIKNLYSPIEKLSELVVDFAESLVSGERVMELLEKDVAVRDAPDAVPAPALRGQVTFENVVFGYRDTAVLKKLNLDVRPGQKIALVGPSGAGKTTVISLLLRFFDPWQGRVLVDGQDIRGFKLKSLREQISVLSQEPVIFRRTVFENIAYGNHAAQPEEVYEAAKAARAHDFILRLKQGYDTLLDERGLNLSGGEKQRIALARAILRDAPIVVLDEPLTGLDAVTEAQVFESLWKLTANKTTFVIAHKLSAVQDADLILVLENGQAVEQGSHSELMAPAGRYRKFYDLQSAGYVAEVV